MYCQRPIKEIKEELFLKIPFHRRQKKRTKMLSKRVQLKKSNNDNKYINNNIIISRASKNVIFRLLAKLNIFCNILPVNVYGVDSSSFNLSFYSPDIAFYFEAEPILICLRRSGFCNQAFISLSTYPLL